MVTLWGPRPEQWSRGSRTGPGQAALGLWTSKGLGRLRGWMPLPAPGALASSDVGRGRLAPTRAQGLCRPREKPHVEAVPSYLGPAPGPAPPSSRRACRQGDGHTEDTRPTASGRAGGRVTLQTPARLGQPPRLQTEDGWGAQGHSEPVGHVPPSAQKGRGRSDVSRLARRPPTHLELLRPDAPMLVAGDGGGRRHHHLVRDSEGLPGQGPGTSAPPTAPPAPIPRSPVCGAGDAHHHGAGAGTRVEKGTSVLLVSNLL